MSKRSKMNTSVPSQEEILAAMGPKDAEEFQSALEWDKSLPNWAPRSLDIPRSNQIPALSRICTNPEMEGVWKTFYRWWGEAYGNELWGSDTRMAQWSFCMRNGPILGGYVEQCDGSITPSPLTQSESKRAANSNKVISHAKLLRRSLRAWGAPESLVVYIDWNVRTNYLRSTLRRFVTELILTGEFGSIYENETGEIEEFESRVFAKIDKFTALQLETENHHSGQYWVESEQYLGSIYDVINLLEIADKWEQPDVIVQRSSSKSQNRLLLIRLLSGWMYSRFARWPKSVRDRKIIATFARVALDDAEIGEDTVKDALKGISPTGNKS